MSAIGDSIIKDGLDNVAKAINNLASAVREGKATESQPVAEDTEHTKQFLDKLKGGKC